MKRTALLPVLGAFLFGPPRAAEACGGFFCNNQPIDQAGEKILFIVDEDGGEVTAHIQIQYAGEASDFSWVVPVVAPPTFDVGSDEIFTRLLPPTTPVHRVESSSRGNCNPCPSGADADADSDGDIDYDTDTQTDSDSGGGVEILDTGIVGPFETVTLASDDPAALETWLVENGYDVPATAGPIIAAYVSADFYFVGLKLTKDAETGDLRPIVLHVPTTTPCIPLRLTAIAATPDMPVYAWVLGDSRAVSTNYYDVVPNDVLIFGGVLDYPEAAKAAIDAAGGRAFVTDFAGASSDYRYTMESAYDTDRFRTFTTPWEVMDEMRSQGFLGSQLVMAILLEHMPPPDGVEPRDFYNSPSDYVDGTYTFDVNALADALEDGIARPLREVHEAFVAFDTLTRLYTVISPSEMTEDPEFAMNPDAPDVEIMRTATVVRDCRNTISSLDDYGDATTDAGHRFCGTDVRAGWGGYYGYYGGQTISGLDEVPLPALERAVLFGASGTGEVVVDEGDAIDDALRCDVPEPDDSVTECPDPYGGDADADGDADTDGDGDADGATSGNGTLCAAVPGSGGSQAALLLTLMALVLVLRGGSRRTPL